MVLAITLGLSATVGRLWAYGVLVILLVGAAWVHLAGNADSAIAVFTRYVETPYLQRIGTDALFLAGAHKLGAETRR